MERRGTVLVVDDDAGTREIAAFVARRLTATCHEADSFAAAVRFASRARVDHALLDLRLPDGDGLDLARALRSSFPNLSWTLITAWATVPTTVQAMKLGALDVLEKPVSLETLEFAVERLVRRSSESASASTENGSPAWPIGGLAHRLARLIYEAASLPEDPRSVESWARGVGISVSSLRELCHILEIYPHDARDLARLIRAVIRVAADGGTVESWLDVSDRRTLERLKHRAGLDRNSGGVAIFDLLERQTFLDSTHPLMARLRELVERR